MLLAVWNKSALTKLVAFAMAAIAVISVCLAMPAFAVEPAGGVVGDPQKVVSIDEINKAFEEVKASIGQLKETGYTEDIKEQIRSALDRADEFIAEAEQREAELSDADKEALGYLKATVFAVRVADKQGLIESKFNKALDELLESIDAAKSAANDRAIIVPTAATGLVYNGKSQVGVVGGKGYAVEGGAAVDAGSYTATATLATGYFWANGTIDPVAVKYTIAKAPQAIKVNKASLKVKAKQVKKKAKRFAVSFSAEGGACTWSKAKSTVKSAKGKATPNKIAIAKNGSIKVAKGAKKGTYLLKVRVSAPETKNYTAASSTVQLTVKVK